MNLRELLARQAELKQKGKKLAYVNGQNDAGGLRDLTAEETTALDAVYAELDAIEPKIEAARANAERLARLEGNTALGTGTVVPVRSNIQVGDDRRTQDPTCGFESLGDFAVTVRRASLPGGAARLDERLAIMQAAAPANTHREGSSQEGYMVPPEHRDRIWQAVSGADDNLFEQSDVEPTNSNMVTDVVDETTPWGGNGITVAMRSEATAMTASRLTPEVPRTVRLDELYAYVVASEELLEDAPRLTRRLEVKVPEAIAWKLSDLVLYGTGVGQPLGIYNSGALISVAKEGSQTADTINAENIIKMYMRLLPGSIPRAYWRMNSDCLMQIMKLKFTDDSPMWVADYREAPGGRLMGLPIVFSQHAKTLGDKGDIMLCDMKGYYGLRRSEVKRAESIHIYFDHNLKAFRSVLRIGGQPHLRTPVSPKNGSTTQSHFVTLDERA